MAHSQTITHTASKRLPPHAIGNAAMLVLSTLHREVVAYGDIELLEEIARQAGVSAVSPHLHPLDLHKRVLNGLERDTRFEKFLFRCCDCNGIREIRVRAFKLKECEDHA